jgi:CubicO group peptidase (beta-lactamase class C family)
MRWAASLLLLSIGCGSSGPPPPPPRFEALETTISKTMFDGGIVGLAAARIEGPTMVWSKGFGAADIAAHRLVEADTPFLIASISKTFVAMLLAQLAEAKKIDLDAPIDGPLGRTLRDPAAPDVPVTPRMLVTHTSGLIDDWIALGTESKDGDYSSEMLSGFVDRYWKPEHFGGTPGTRWEYCNAGFGILGAVVEAAAGEDLPSLTARRIFTPLGLTSSGWRISDVGADRLAVPYSGPLQEGPIPSAQMGWTFFPATSMHTNVIDLSRFLSAFVMDGGGLVTATTAASMRTIERPDLNGNQAFAWYYETIDGHRYLGHTGSAIGTSALIFFDPDTKVGAVVLTNSDAFVRSRLGKPEMAKALYAITAAILEAP